MHIVIMVCLAILLYQTGFILSFLNGYIQNPTIVRGQDVVSRLHTDWFFILPIISGVLLIMILSVLIAKKKPKIFYIVCLVGHLAFFYVYSNGLNVLSNLETTVVDLRTIRAARDLYLYSMIFQFIFVVLTLFRSLGFDHKKFDFREDLENLDISAEDSEEFEIDFDFDISDQKRKGKRILRHLKYKYKENKFIAHIGLGILAVIVIGVAYSRFTIYNRVSPEGTNFSMNGSTMGVRRSFVVNTDHQGNDITGGDRYIVVVDLMVRSSGREPIPLNVGAITLDVGGSKYNHEPFLVNRFNDLGTVYTNQVIDREFENHLLIFEIPMAAVGSRKTLEFTNLHSGNIVRVRLDPDSLLSGRETHHRAILGETMDFSGTILGNTTFRITSASIEKKFPIQYTFTAPRTGTQIQSTEYLAPRVFEHGFSMALLRIEAKLNLYEDIAIPVTSVVNLISEFGTIEYVIDDEIFTQDLFLGTVASRRRRERNVYYFQVFEEIGQADSVALVFKIRNDIFRYYIR